MYERKATSSSSSSTDLRKRKREEEEGGSTTGLSLSSSSDSAFAMAEQVRFLTHEVKKLRGEVSSMKNAMHINHLLSVAQEAGDKELELVHQGFTSKSLPHFGQAFHVYMISITTLDLSFNNLEEFPVGLSSLPCLGDLYLSHNKIQTIPRSLGLLTQLRTLSLNHNRLRDLGEGVRMLSNIRDLIITHNKETLHYLPEGFRLMLHWEPYAQRVPIIDNQVFRKANVGVFYDFPSLLDICCNVVAGFTPGFTRSKRAQEFMKKMKLMDRTSREGEEEDGGDEDVLDYEVEEEGEEGAGRGEDAMEAEGNDLFDHDDDMMDDFERGMDDEGELNENNNNNENRLDRDGFDMNNFASYDVHLPWKNYRLLKRGPFTLMDPASYSRPGGPNERKDKKEIRKGMRRRHPDFRAVLPTELQETLLRGVMTWQDCTLCARPFYGPPRVTKISKLEYYSQKLVLRGTYCSLRCYHSDQILIKKWYREGDRPQQRQRATPPIPPAAGGGDASGVGNEEGGDASRMLVVPAAFPNEGGQQQGGGEDEGEDVEGYLVIEQDPDVAEAIKKGICTFNVTGRKYRGHARMWRCYTCGFEGDDPQEGSACCDSCSKVCHAGHDLSEVIVLGDWFCDCGAGLKGVQCQILDEEGKRKRAEDVLESSESEEDGY